MTSGLLAKPLRTEERFKFVTAVTAPLTMLLVDERHQLLRLCEVEVGKKCQTLAFLSQRVKHDRLTKPLN